MSKDLETRFLELIGTNRGRLLRLSRAYAFNPHDQEDIYQEMLFQIWRSLPQLKEGVFSDTWLYRVALNTAISHVRKTKTLGRQKSESAESEVQAMLESSCQSPTEISSALIALYEAIDKLDKAEKALITLYLEDLSYAQMGEVLGVETNHVGVMLHRARKKLAELMKEPQP